MCLVVTGFHFLAWPFRENLDNVLEALSLFLLTYAAVTKTAFRGSGKVAAKEKQMVCVFVHVCVCVYYGKRKKKCKCVCVCMYICSSWKKEVKMQK